MTQKTTTCERLQRRLLSVIFRLSTTAVTACSWSDKAPQTEPGPTAVLKVETSIHNRLVENSIAVTSVSQPGIIFGLNDSGNGPYLFAFDSTGRGRGYWQVAGAQNRDWEAAAMGRCSSQADQWSCLYIGDVGDNDARKPRLTIYRIPEPEVEAIGHVPQAPKAIQDVGRLDFRYSDHPHDVEAMYVARDGAIFLITKRRLLDGQRRARPALIFRIPPAAWDSSGVVTAALVDSLPIVPGERQGGQVSDAALTPDGKSLAVRTYADVYIFAMDTTTGLPRDGVETARCVIDRLREKQGEGIGWWWDRRRLVLTSEGRHSPMYVVACPLPDS